LPPPARAVFQGASTSCQSSVANRNPARRRGRRGRGVGVGERQIDEPLPERLLEDDVDHRQQAVREPVRAKAFERLDGVAGQQKLLHLVEQARSPGRSGSAERASESGRRSSDRSRR
jgi:hypothetical protein